MCLKHEAVKPRNRRETLRQLYEAHAYRVYERCLYFLRDRQEAEDAMHDVFIKADKNLASFRGEASPLTWLTRIATNHCLNIIRAKKAAWHDKYRREVENAPRGEQKGAERTETEQLVRLCLAQVDPELAEIATYYFVDEMTQKEITELVGISAPTLRKRLRLFIEQSRAEIEKAVPGVTFRPPPV